MSEAGVIERPFYFIRHGETDWNRAGICVGGQNPPLNETGQRQADRAAVRYANISAQLVCSSPLSRALTTAETLAGQWGTPVSIENELRECSLGIWEGKPEDDLAMFDDWRAGQTPEGGESFRSFAGRVRQGLNRALSVADRVVIVAHTGVFWAICDWLNINFRTDIPHTELLLIQPDSLEETRWSIHKVRT